MAMYSSYSAMDISALVEGMDAGVLEYAFEELKELQTELINRKMSSRYIGMVSAMMREMIESGEVEAGKKPVNKAESLLSAEDVDESRLTRKKPASRREKLVEDDIPPTKDEIIDELISHSHKVPETSSKKPSFTPVKLTLDEFNAATTPPSELEPAKLTDFEPAAKNSALKRNRKRSDTRTTRAPSSTPDDVEDTYLALVILAGFAKVMAWLSILGVVAAYVYIAIEFWWNSMEFVLLGAAAAIALSALLALLWFALSQNITLKLNIEKRLKELQS